MSARIDDLLGQLEVVVQRVEVLVRIAQIACVAHRDFGYRRTGFTHCVDGGPHRFDVVERIEDPVDVDTGGGRFLHEGLRHRFRIRRVANGIAAPQHICRQMFGTASRSAASRSHGSSSRTEAPHRMSRRPSTRSTAAGGSSARCRARPSASPVVRTRVASSDWCASRNVVSVTPTDFDRASSARNPRAPARSAAACCRGRWRVEIDLGQLVLRVHRRRRGPCGRLTVTSAR